MQEEIGGNSCHSPMMITSASVLLRPAQRLCVLSCVFVSVGVFVCQKERERRGRTACLKLSGCIRVHLLLCVCVLVRLIQQKQI